MRFKTIMFFLLSVLNCGLHGQMLNSPDSIIYTHDNSIMAQIFNEGVSWRSDRQKECRLYNAEGFYCLSLYYGADGWYRGCYIGRVDPNIDLIFNSDSFDIKFINVLNSIDNEGFTEKYNRTLRYFYKVHNYNLDSNLVQYINSNVPTKVDEIGEANYLISDTIDADTSEVEEVFVYNTPNVPKLTPRYKLFCSVIQSSVKLSKSEKKKNNNRLYFRIVADFRKTEELVCLSDMRNVNKKRIDKELKKLKSVRLYPSPRGGPMKKLKAVFYVEIN